MISYHLLFTLGLSFLPSHIFSCFPPGMWSGWITFWQPCWSLKKRLKDSHRPLSWHIWATEPAITCLQTSDYKIKISLNILKSLRLIVILVILVIFLPDRIANYLILSKTFWDISIVYILPPHIATAALCTHANTAHMPTQHTYTYTYAYLTHQLA